MKHRNMVMLLKVSNNHPTKDSTFATTEGSSLNAQLNDNAQASGASFFLFGGDTKNIPEV
jgi:hypothetical protein